tara:strand:+ start:657 stop:1160 length:504 start_codon:yes stop_codon:yes gene_type:complete
MARFTAKMVNDVTRTPDCLMEGTYKAQLESMAVRLAGKANERLYITYRVQLPNGELEAQVRRAEVPLSWSAMTNPQGADPRHIGLFAELLDITGAQPEKTAADGPSVFGITGDGEEIHVALGKYEPKPKKRSFLAHIGRSEANDFQMKTGRCDRANYVNTLDEVQQP